MVWMLRMKEELVLYIPIIFNKDIYGVLEIRNVIIYKTKDLKSFKFK